MRVVNRALVLLVLVVASLAHASKPSTVLHHKPTLEGPEERPVATEVAVTARDGGFQLVLTFDKPPFGESCKVRCANTTVYLDTDDVRRTGLQVGDKAAATGADLAVTVQGAREWGEQSAHDLLRVRVRRLSSQAKSLEDGEAIADLQLSQDGDRVQLKDRTLTVRVDASTTDVPAGKKARVVYQPPGTRALTTTIPGLLTPSRGGKRR
jgi:hypothetical protein